MVRPPIRDCQTLEKNKAVFGEWLTVVETDNKNSITILAVVVVLQR